MPNLGTFSPNLGRFCQNFGTFDAMFGTIDSKFGKIINNALIRRTKGDYESFTKFEKDAIIEMFDDMKEFILEIEGVWNIS